MNKIHLAGMTLRHSGVISPTHLATDITIIGAGAIGSMAAVALAKMGATKLHLWDGDTVEVHNLGNQFYGMSAIGKNKALAAHDMIREFAGIEVDAHPMHWEWGGPNGPTPPPQGIVIAATDNMASRRAVYDACKDNFDVQLFIDARMALEELRVLAIDPNVTSDQRVYEASWHPDEEGVQAACTAKSIVYCAMFAGAEIAKRVKQFLLNQASYRHVMIDLPTLEVAQIA